MTAGDGRNRRLDRAGTTRALGRVIAVVAVAAGLAPWGVEAQLHLAPELGWSRSRDFGVGGRAGWDVWNGRVIAELINFFPSADGLADPDVGVNRTYWEANLNVLYPMDELVTRVYAGAGAGYARRLLTLEHDGFRSEADVSDWAANLIVGARLPRDGPSPFAEAKMEVGRNRQFVFVAGVDFPTGPS